MKIALASDAWTPQTNGVVTTLKCTAETLIATEGPVGLAVRRYCRARRVPFTAARTFVSSATLEAQLSARGFPSLHRWPRPACRSRPSPCPDRSM